MMAMRTEPLAKPHPLPQVEPLPGFPGAQVLPRLRESELRAGMSLKGGKGWRQDSDRQSQEPFSAFAN